jgi:hypothetical protein
VVSLSNFEKSYILTGDTAQSLDFTKYQKTSYCFEPQVIVSQKEQHWQEPNLFFDPSSSDSDSSEDPDYIPPKHLQRNITTSYDSWLDNWNSIPSDQPSTSKLTGEQSNPIPDSESDTSTDSGSIISQPNDTDTVPATSPRGRPPGTKNITDLWKNTASTKWKPPMKIVIEPDPEAITTRTRSKNA